MMQIIEILNYDLVEDVYTVKCLLTNWNYIGHCISCGNFGVNAIKTVPGSGGWGNDFAVCTRCGDVYSDYGDDVKEELNYVLIRKMKPEFVRW